MLHVSHSLELMCVKIPRSSGRVQAHETAGIISCDCRCNNMPHGEETMSSPLICP